MPTKKKTSAKPSATKKPEPVQSGARDVLEKVMIAVATNIITAGLAAAWPHIHAAIGHLSKFEVAKDEVTRGPNREDKLAGILLLLGQLGLKAQKFREIVKACDLSDEELGEQLGELISRRLSKGELVDVDDLLLAANSYGLTKNFDAKLEPKADTRRIKVAP